MAKYVKIGTLRNHLSGYLRKVRAGAEIIIADRETPIGKIIPFEKKGGSDFRLIDPPKGYAGLSTLTFPPCDPPLNVVDLLLEERRKR